MQVVIDGLNWISGLGPMCMMPIIMFVIGATGLGSEFISGLLKERLSMTFPEFVCREKMIWAAGLLRDIHLSIGEIAARTGYTNSKNFSRAFHNYYHMTPMQYRKKGET